MMMMIVGVNVVPYSREPSRAERKLYLWLVTFLSRARVPLFRNNTIKLVDGCSRSLCFSKYGNDLLEQSSVLGHGPIHPIS